jgi:hypothetical protein
VKTYWLDTCIKYDKKIYRKNLQGAGMSISSVNNYRDVLFQWQGQQLKNTGKGSSSQSGAITSLFGQASITSQIESMVELTKYAMDAMGVDKNGRVTFNQISKYSQKLQSEFNQGVKDGFANSGISDLSGLSFSLDKNGKINAIGANEKDRKKAQEWLDANSDIGKNMLKALNDADIEITEEVLFDINSNGKFSVRNAVEDNLQFALDGNASLTENLRSELKKLGVDVSAPIDFMFNEDGNLVVKGDHNDAKTINSFLSQNTELADAVKKELKKNDVDLSSAGLRLGNEGNIQISINNSGLKDLQAALDKETELGKKIYSSLDDLGIDPNISFSIQLNADGTYNIISDHPDAAKVQKFFEDNPELIKKYRQIDTLAGVDDARKAMQLSPSEMRKRIQVESMTAWWAGSGNANSYFGAYNNGNLSLYSGLNLNI